MKSLFCIFVVVVTFDHDIIFWVTCIVMIKWAIVSSIYCFTVLIMDGIASNKIWQSSGVTLLRVVGIAAFHSSNDYRLFNTQIYVHYQNCKTVNRRDDGPFYHHYACYPENDIMVKGRVWFWSLTLEHRYLIYSGKP
jgi:hypothetical protein